MMRTTIVRQELAVGAFLIGAAVLVGVGGFLKTRERGLLGSATFRFTAPHGSGLQPGAPVTMHGVQVGEVSDIQLAADHRVLVTCQVAPRFAGHLTTDAKATIVEPPLLGSTKVEVVPGSGAAAAADQELAGDTQGSITAQLSDVQKRLDAVVDRVDRVVENVDAFVTQANGTLASVDRVVTKVEMGDGLLGQLVADEQLAADVRAGVAGLARVTEAVEPDAVRGAVAGVAAVVSRLDRGEGLVGRLLNDAELADQAEGLVSDARGALQRLDELNAQTQKSLQKVETLLDTANTAVGDVQKLVGNAEKVSGELADTLHRVNQGQGTVAAFLNDDAVYRETRSLLKELRESVEDLREQAPINSFIGVVFSAF
jgi:phospholipid/cholesterol/gamma-HCH transport system substrate-binding protein